jgi:hypothetical protein
MATAQVTLSSLCDISLLILLLLASVGRCQCGDIYLKLQESRRGESIEIYPRIDDSHPCRLLPFTRSDLPLLPSVDPLLWRMLKQSQGAGDPS